jgi:hypothetical protein
MSALHRTFAFTSLVLLIFAVTSCGSAEAPTVNPTTPTATPQPRSVQTAPNAIDLALYFNSAAQDDDGCTLQLGAAGSFRFGEGVTNPAMTCPDAFAWKLFVEALRDEFWVNWAADAYTWPALPLPLCSAELPAETPCCRPGSLTNPGYDNAQDPATNCPYFPGDHVAAGAEPITPQGQPLSKAHANAFSLAASALADDPGRVIRQEMSELVYRNKPMFDYVFANDLYHTDGLSRLFAHNSQAMAGQAPYRPRNTPGALATVEFPVQAVMIKSNWLSAAQAEAIGLTDDPANPYITMEIDAAVLDNDAPDDQFAPGLYYLVSMHISSKDIPNWVWATFEHVNNPGRCDYTGCNDSFGYASPDAVGEGFYTNFTAPHVITDGLVIASPIFATGEAYADGARNPALQAVFDGMGIGRTAQADPARPDPASRGWLSYRLKGSQVNFTDAIGRATLVGNSITEGGFVATSSCMSCHARAAVNAEGRAPLGVFLAELSEVGYPQSASGAPDPDWYYSSSNHPSLLALQTDFVWGFLAANPITTTVSTTE